MNALERFIWDPEDVEWNAGGQKDFDPNQPRDEFGRWTGGGALDVVAFTDPTKKFPEPRELPTFGLTQAAQDEVYTRMERAGITHAALADEIAARIGGPRSPVMEEALSWYPEAKGIASTLSNSSGGRVDQKHAEAVIAALSPQMAWDNNVDAATKLIDFVANGRADGKTVEDATLEFIKDPGHQHYFQSARTFQTAMRIAQGGDIDENLHGLKVRSFFNNIDDPNGTRDVTIDTHMVKAFAAVSPGLPKTGTSGGSALGLLNWSSLEDGAEFGGAGYTVMSEAVRAVSTAWGVPPDAIQAAYWLEVRDIPYDEIQGAAR